MIPLSTPKTVLLVAVADSTLVDVAAGDDPDSNTMSSKKNHRQFPNFISHYYGKLVDIINKCNMYINFYT